MSSAKKTALTVAGICVALGILVFIIGAVMIGFDFKVLGKMDFEDKTHNMTEDFSDIEISGIECDIRFELSTDGQCRVVTTDSQKILTSVETENGTLTVTRTDARAWYERIGIWYGEDLAITVYLPQKEYGKLYIKSVSGDIDVPYGFTFQTAEVLSTSGDISFEAVTNNGLTVKTTSGDLEAKNATGGTVAVKAVSGDIILSKISAEELTVETTSGDIELRSVLTKGKTDIQAVSGDVELNSSDAGSFYVKTVSGSVGGSILSPKNFITKTTSGDFSIPASDTSAGAFEVTTTSGDVRISIE